jgi:uncharacterized protein Yka (UPF0111/DUF47 family)
MEPTENGAFLTFLKKGNERLKALNDRIAGIKKDLDMMLECSRRSRSSRSIPSLSAEYETIVIEGHMALTKVEIELTDITDIEEYLLMCTQAQDPESFLDRIFQRIEKKLAEAESSWVLDLKNMANQAEEVSLACLLASLDPTTQVL